jgi:hypothetical protein
MSEEHDVINRELLGGESKPCALCGISKPQSSLILVSGEVIGVAGGGNVDICTDCYQGLQRGDVDPAVEPEP